MATRQYRTLGELRTEMRALIGHAASGAAAGPAQTIIDTHLRNAQTRLYWHHDWVHLKIREDDELGLGQYQLDYPDTANPDRIKAISVFRGGVWSKPLERGITPSLLTYQENRSWPQRWEPMMQATFWPSADQIYPIRWFFIRNQLALTADGNRFTIDDTLVSLVATASLKAHYRQPDAQLAITAAENMMISLKAKSWGRDVFRPGDFIEEEPLVRPQVVTT